MTRVRELLFGHCDPFSDVKPGNLDLQGWNSDSEVFRRLIIETGATKVCEVGSWKGTSAIHMANQLASLGRSLDAEVICVDTWLGSLEMWTDPQKRILMNFRNGRAGIYEIFLQNVRSTLCDGIITPFPATSTMAAQFFRHHGVKFDLIYIDASHEAKEVFADIRNYERLGIIIFGDDYDWPTVREAVDSFSNQNLREFALEIDREKWILRRR